MALPILGIIVANFIVIYLYILTFIHNMDRPVEVELTGIATVGSGFPLDPDRLYPGASHNGGPDRPCLAILPSNLRL